MQKTLDAISRQIDAMGSPIFEVGLFKTDVAGGSGYSMIPRTWDIEHIKRSVPWMRLQNLNGRNIYVRPAGEHNLSLVDDLNDNSLRIMERAGFQPALVVETSPKNFQAWVKHNRVLPKEVGTAAARELADRFGGDAGAADWRHFGRLAGFTNRKAKYQSLEGLFPFVKLLSATGQAYDQADSFVREIEARVRLDREKRQERAISCAADARSGPRRTIEDFRSNPSYGGDKTRSDLAFAIYAFSRGMSDIDVCRALSSRDLSHKGNEKRQNEYVERTIKKAMAIADARGCCSRS